MARPGRGGAALRGLVRLLDRPAPRRRRRRAFLQVPVPEGELTADHAPPGVWLAGTAPSRPSLAADLVADVAVVGGGVAGTVAALTLAEGGARVVLLEARAVAAAASGRNAGFLLTGTAENQDSAIARHGEATAAHLLEVTRRSQRLLRAVVTRESIDCALEWPGSDLIAGDAAEWVEIERGVAPLRAAGVRVAVHAAERRITLADDGAIDPAA
ncbi:MAG: FAD-binding oxidoreductase, partial [Chloroflexi bacterium]|nr:FAD-binding oxidoreductase [Chloroflexota bacterium]